MSAPRHGEGADSSNTSSLTASLSSRFQGFLSRNQGKIDNVTSKLDTLSKSVYGYFTQSAPTDSNVPTSVLEALSPDALGFNYVTRNVISMSSSFSPPSVSPFVSFAHMSTAFEADTCCISAFSTRSRLGVPLPSPENKVLVSYILSSPYFLWFM